MAGRHRTIIDSDQPVSVQVVPEGWWFKAFHSWVDSGWWAAIQPAAAKVLIVLAKHANSERICWPGHSLIEKETGLPRSTIYAALNQLEAATLITRRSRGYGSRLTVYEILEPKRRPASQTVQQAGPVQPARLSRQLSSLPEPESSLPDSPSTGIGNRSSSEQKELKPGRLSRGAEIERWVDSLTEEEAADVLGVVLATMDAETRAGIGALDLKANRVLRSFAYATVHSEARS